MDISNTLAPTSDQLDAVDLLGGPRTFTIAKVSAGNDEQPVQVHLAEFPRVWRPGKSMRRVLAAAWGPHAQEWTGRRVTLYCDPTVKFGGEAVGGTRISHMSHLKDNKPVKVPLLVTRGRSAMFTVQPLKEAPKPAPVDWHALVTAATTSDECRDIWKRAAEAGALDDDLKAAITGRVSELEKPADPEPVDDFFQAEEVQG